MIDQVIERLETERQDALDRLKQLLSIQSVSTDPSFRGECEKAARWVGQQLEACGLSVEIRPTDGHPIVIGRSAEVPGAPTVLYYGHYDVQPPDPVEQWDSPPFEPTIRDRRIYARGASDDKGQMMCFIEALRAWKETAGGLPVNVRVVVEGEEECGSVAIGKLIESEPELLRSDIAVVSDTAMWDYHQPAIAYALRGLVYFDVKLHGPERDLHSGVYGGAVPNPATELARVLAQLFDADRRITLPGFYDRVEPVSDEERAQWEVLNFDDAGFAGSIGVEALTGEAGYTTLERRWARPSCDVNGLYGGYMGYGAKTVIPSSAGAKVSFRIVADQEPDEVATAFRQWLEDRTPPGCRWEVKQFAGARPVIVPTDSPYLRAATEAVESGCGRAPSLIRDGATIPVVSTFKTDLGVDTLLVGFGLNDDNLHSPNEKFELECFDMGRRTHAALIHRLANVG